eukprot:2030461-Prymnesium_polylepis.1
MSSMGGLRIMYIPSHVGSYLSAYADAAAKAYLRAAHVEGVTAVWQGSRSAAVVMEAESTAGGWALMDEPAYRGVEARYKEWEGARVALAG